MSEIKYLTLDSTDTIFFERELEVLKARSYDVKYPELKARQIIPISYDAGEGAEYIKYQQYDHKGIAKFISAYGSDLPRSDISGKEFVVRVKDYGASFGYNDKEIRNARMANKPLEQRKMLSARRSMEELLNKTTFLGNDEHGIVGFLNNPNIPRSIVPAGVGGLTTFRSKTPAEILADLNNLVNNITELTKQTEQPNRLIMPVAQFNYISTTPFSVNDNRSILEIFLQNSPYITTREQVIAVNELAGAGTGGSDLMVAYTYSPEHLTLEIPMEMKMLPIERRNLEYVQNMIASTGGVIVYYPLSVNIAEGI